MQIDFQTSFEDIRFVNVDWHPNLINLQLWDNFYQIEFADAEYVDQNDLMFSSRYKFATISGLLEESNSRKVNATLRNITHLYPQHKQSFNRINIDKIASIVPGIRECKLKIYKSGNYQSKEEAKNAELVPLLVVDAKKGSTVE